MNDGPLVGVCLFPGSGENLIGCVALHTDFSGIEPWVGSVAAGATPEISVVPRFEGGTFEFFTNDRVVFVAIAKSTKTITRINVNNDRYSISKLWLRMPALR